MAPNFFDRRWYKIQRVNELLEDLPLSSGVGYEYLDIPNGNLNFLSLPVIRCESCGETYGTGDGLDLILSQESKEVVARFSGNRQVVSEGYFRTLLQELRLAPFNSNGIAAAYPGNRIFPGVWSTYGFKDLEFFWPLSPCSGILTSGSALAYFTNKSDLSCSLKNVFVYDIQNQTFVDVEVALLTLTNELSPRDWDCPRCRMRDQTRYGLGLEIDALPDTVHLLRVFGVGIIADEEFYSLYKRNRWRNIEFRPLSTSYHEKIRQSYWFSGPDFSKPFV